MRATVATFIACAIAMATTACDPCAGVLTGCADAPRVSADGKIVDHPQGTPAEGVIVTLALEPGGTPVASAVTDERGFYHLAASVGEVREFDAELRVEPPGSRAYRVPRRLSSTTLRGGGTILETMVARPYFNAIAPVVDRCDDSKTFAHQPFTFRFGNRQNPIAGTITAGTTDSSGYIVFLAPAFVADTFLPLSADLLLPDAPGRLAGALRVGQDYVFRAPLKLATVRVARDSTYVGCVINEATNKPLAGIAVDFSRTGGAATQVSAFSTVTNSTGAFELPLVPLEPGPVVGTLTVRPPAPATPRVFTGAVIGSSIEPADTLRSFPVDAGTQGGARMLHRGKRVP